MSSQVDEVLLRSLTPSVLAILVRRGADFAAAEDAVQDALVEAVRVWPTDPPRDPKGSVSKRLRAAARFCAALEADASPRARCADITGSSTVPSAMPSTPSGNWFTRSA